MAGVTATIEKERTDDRRRDPESGRIVIESVDEIPTFASDEEELEFWNSHEPSMKFFEGVPRVTVEEALKAKGLPKR